MARLRKLVNSHGSTAWDVSLLGYADPIAASGGELDITAAHTDAEIDGFLRRGDLTLTADNKLVVDDPATTTRDITSNAGFILVTDAALVTGAASDADTLHTHGRAIHDNVSGEICALPLKTVPTVADILVIEDCADASSKKRITAESLLGSPELGVGTELFSQSGRITTSAITWQTITTIVVAPVSATKFILTFSAAHTLSSAAKSGEFLVLNPLPTPFAVDQFDRINDYIYLESGEGDLTAQFPAGKLFSVVGATNAGNNKVYEAVSAIFTGGKTRITIDGALTPIVSNEAIGSPAEVEGWSILNAFLYANVTYEWGQLGRQVLLDLPIGTHTYKVSYRSSDTGTTAMLRNLLFSIQRVVQTDF